MILSLKNLISILLITVHVFAYTDAVQVFKFPNLIKHYQEHHVKNTSVGFIDFLVMHYGNCDDGDSKDDWEDMQLPFKSLDLHLIGFAIIVPQQTMVQLVQAEFYNDFCHSNYTPIILTTYQRSLLRPPISIA
jgi:hypothetical protein